MQMLQNEFRHKGVDFVVIKQTGKAVMLKASADFYDCESLEVWKYRERKEAVIQERVVPMCFWKPSDNDYYYTAHQYMRKHYKTDEAFRKAANDRFDAYEAGKEVDMNRI